MTVTNTTNKDRSEGNGITTIFPASIKIFAETDIKVTTIVRATDVLANTLVLNDAGALGYTVTFDTDAETLSVTTVTPPSATEDLQILRVLPQTQTTDFPRATKFPAESNENALDKNTMILQDQQENIDRAFVLPEESSATNPTLPNPSSRKALVWDPAEDGTIINSANDPDEQATAAAASAAAAASSASAASTSAANALASETNAGASATAAADSAASINLPTITIADAGKGLEVNAGGTGYDLTDVFGSLAFASSVSNAELADMVEATIKGRAAGAGTGAPVDLTAAQVKAIVGSAVAPSLLINSNFDIWERGTSLTTTGARVYAADRWEISSGQNITGARIAGDATRYAFKLQRDASETSTTEIKLAQTLETSDSEYLQGQEVTLSFRAKMGANYSSASDLITINIATGTGTDESVLAGLTGQVNDESTETLTASYQTFTKTLTLASGATEVAVLLSYDPVGTAGADDSISFEWVKLELGAVATNFVPNKVSEETDNCLRYYCKSGTDYAFLLSVSSVSQPSQDLTVGFPTTMRSSPTIATTQNAGSGALGAIQAQSAYGFRQRFTGADNFFVEYSWTADAEL